MLGSTFLRRDGSEMSTGVSRTIDGLQSSDCFDVRQAARRDAHRSSTTLDINTSILT